MKALTCHIEPISGMNAALLSLNRYLYILKATTGTKFNIT
jgi:hypothetical protein